MKHFYESIQGWFDFQEIYSKQVEIAKNGFHFVEIGAWLGKSTAFMAVEIIRTGKKIKFDVIDTWEGSENEINSNHRLAKEHDVFELFINNLRPVHHIINPLKLDSVSASELYEDRSIDFIFIDANHSYEFVKNDISSWYPKLKVGGYMGGHDYNLDGVSRAVREYFADNIQEKGISWLHEKKDP